MLTLLLAGVAAVGLSGLALVATLVDARLRANEADAYRQGLASRLAALVYPDEQGQWIVEGIVDDMANEAADAVLVATRSGDVLYQNADISSTVPMLPLALADEAEVGVIGTITVGGQTMPAAAAPFWDFETVEGAVIVALADVHQDEHTRLRLLVWGTALGLTLLSAAAAWLIAGRVVKPIGEALDREERFLATAAHEIRTPLGRVRALAESALRSWSQLSSENLSPRSAQLGEELRRLVTVAGQTSESANDLLLAGRIDASQLELRREPLRLDNLVADFEATVPGLAVETSGPVEIIGDSVLVRHAVSNLLSNAAHHGRANSGTSVIHASVQPVDGEAWVSVSDNGPGLGAINPERIFDRYRRSASGGTSSTGLGLWIVQSIMGEHRGVVDVYANEPSGTVFVLRFPLITR